VTKDVEISEHRENSLKANGYSVTAISFEGSMSFMGHRIRGPGSETHKLNDLLFDDEGAPVPGTITITHQQDESTDTLEQLLAVLASVDTYSVQREPEGCVPGHLEALPVLVIAAVATAACTTAVVVRVAVSAHW
jgi:hypothetical protein